MKKTKKKSVKAEGGKVKARLDRTPQHFKEGGHWIQKAIKHPGALHKELHVKEGEKIPASKLKKAEHSKNPLLKKRAVLAETLKGLKKK